MDERYFEILGLARGADKKEIKRAYFRLVREFTPEKDPDRFRQIREAYEYLSNRQEEGERPVFLPYSDPFGEKMENQIFDAERGGNLELACDTAAEAWKLFPEDIRFLYRLTILQRRAGHTGKAVKNAELLVKKEKDNKWFWRELAVSYMERGYTNKAYGAFYKAYDLGIRDTDFLTMYARECYDFGQYRRGKEVITDVLDRKKHWEEESMPELTDLLMSLLDMTLAVDRREVMGIWDRILILARESRMSFGESAEELLLFLSAFESRFDQGDGWFPKYREVAEILLSQVQDPKARENIKGIMLSVEIQTLVEDKRFEPHLGLLADLRLHRTELSMSSFEFKFNEAELLLFLYKRRDEVLLQLPLLSSDYPGAYEAVKDLEDKLSDEEIFGQEREKVLSFYRKNMPYMSGESEYFAAYPEERFESGVRLVSDGLTGTPYIRTEKKVGRNDPCPCGSGKKFKQCCMKK